MATTEEGIWKDTLDSYGDQYKEILETWKLVETKAQSMTTLGGVFLAAAFAWTREVPKGFRPIDDAVLCLLMLVLAISIGCAIFSMRVKTTVMPPHGRVTRETTDDLTREGFKSENVVGYYRTLTDRWEDANGQLIAKISDKARMVYASQVMLGWAAGLSFLLAIRAVTGDST